MTRFRALAAILLTLMAMTAMGQKKTTATRPAAPKKAAPSGDIFPFPVTEKTLPNRLKVIVVETGFPNIVSLQIPVQTGSRNEVEPGKSGFAHFFEHMMFRGTKAYPPEKYQDILTQIGARQNAYTTNDYTNYHTTFSKEDLDRMLRIEADRFMHLDYSPEGFKTEARAVLGEYNKNSANPLFKLEEVQHEKAFTTHTYKHTTMGFLKDIEDMPNQLEYSKTFLARWYRPEYTTVIVAGDVKPAEVIRAVEKYWGGWKPGGYKVAVPQEPPPTAPVYTHVSWTSPTLPWVSVAFHGSAFSDTKKDFAAMDMIFDLYFGETSDLHKKLVEDEQKVDQLFADSGGTQDPGLSTVYARVKKAEDAVYVRDEIVKTFAKAASEPAPAQRLADAKSNGRYGLARRFDNTETIAAILARFVRYERSAGILDRLYRVYTSLTPSDLQTVAKKYFTDSGMVVATLSKDPLPEAIAKLPGLAAVAPKAASAGAEDFKTLIQKIALPQLNVK